MTDEITNFNGIINRVETLIDNTLGSDYDYNTLKYSRKQIEDMEQGKYTIMIYPVRMDTEEITNRSSMPIYTVAVETHYLLDAGASHDDKYEEYLQVLNKMYNVLHHGDFDDGVSLASVSTGNVEFSPEFRAGRSLFNSIIRLELKRYHST